MPYDLKSDAGGAPYVPTEPVDAELRAYHSFLFDDFLHRGFTANDYGQLVCNGANVSVVVTEHGGIVSLNGGFSYFSTFGMRAWGNLNAGDMSTVEWRAKVVNRPASGAMTGAGFSMNPVNNNDVILIVADNLGNFKCESRVGGVQKFLADSGVAFDNAWHRFKIIIEHTQVRFYIDGNLVYTHAVNPGVDFVQAAMDLWAYVSNATCEIYLDWVYAIQNFPVNRNP